MSLIDLLTGNTGNEVAQKAENKFGISKSQIFALLVVAAPLIISYLRNKSKNEKEAEALNNALDKKHDGSILNDLSQVENRQEEGGSILNHVFGEDKEKIENQLSTNSGISMDKIGPILSMLAPVIMGYIGKEKKENNVGAGGISDLLGGILNPGNGQNTGNNPLQDLLGSVLGGGNPTNSNSGNIVGDLLGGLLGGNSKNNSGTGGGLGDLLGGFLGKK